MGQLDSNVQSPTFTAPGAFLVEPVQVIAELDGGPDDQRAREHDVALQVAFERQTLKAVFHLIGYRLWV
jgi:hypothetical protein